MKTRFRPSRFKLILLYSCINVRVALQFLLQKVLGRTNSITDLDKENNQNEVINGLKEVSLVVELTLTQLLGP